MSERRRQNLAFAAVSLAIAVPFLLIYSYYTSPIASKYGYDQAFFQLIGMGMTDGMAPYRDFHDMKGPYLFFFEWFGQMLVRGRAGCFAMQCCLMVATLFLIQKIVQLAYSNRPDTGRGKLLASGVAACAICLIPFSISMEGGNLPEELSLPFLMAATYCNLRFFVDFDSGREVRYKASWAFVNGLCVCVMAFIRVTNAAFVLTTLLCVTIAMIHRGAGARFLRALGWFAAGVLAAMAPVIAYCVWTGTLADMFYLVFAFGFMYAGDGFDEHLDAFVNVFHWQLPRLMLIVLAPVVVTAFLHVRKAWCWGVSLLGALSTFVAVFLGYGFLHYAGIAIPLVALAVFLFIYRAHDEVEVDRRKMVLAALLAGSLIAVQLPAFARVSVYSAKAVKYHFTVSDEDKIAPGVKRVLSVIPQDERGSVFFFGNEYWSRWYCISDCYPALRYFDYQRGHFNHDPNLEGELRHDMDENPPQWVIVKDGYEKISPSMQLAIGQGYSKVSEDGDYSVYRRDA